jgi:hypothetical protein
MPLLLYLATGINAPFPILQDTSLYVIHFCIKKYRMVMGPDAVTPVLGSMVTLLETAPSPAIVSRIFLVLKAMIVTSRRIGPSFLTDHFDDVYRFPLFALERPDAMETVIFSQAHHIICMLIEKAPEAFRDVSTRSLRRRYMASVRCARLSSRNR